MNRRLHVRLRTNPSDRLACRAAWILARRISIEIRVVECRSHELIVEERLLGQRLRDKTAALNADCSAVFRSIYEVTGGVEE